MKLYRLTQTSNVAEVVVRRKWAGTQAEAASVRKEWNSKLHVPRDQIMTEELDVPTDKKGLLAWLNANC